jgi:hypothetical protein
MIIRVSNHADRIRLIAIENMKGAFENEGALRFLKRNLGSGRVSRVGCGVLAATGFPPIEKEKFANPRRFRQHAARCATQHDRATVLADFRLRTA